MVEMATVAGGLEGVVMVDDINQIQPQNRKAPTSQTMIAKIPNPNSNQVSGGLVQGSRQREGLGVRGKAARLVVTGMSSINP